MEWKDVTDAISKYAPEAESLLGAASLIPGAAIATGPAAAAVAAIAKVFGTEPTPAAIQQAITTDPAAAQKLMEAENNYSLSVMKEETEKLKAQLADVQNARQREVDITKVTGKRDWNLYALSWVITIGFFVSLIATFLYKVPPENKDMMTYLVVTLQNGTILCWSYYYGSSKGSAEKTTLLAKAEPIRD